MIDWHVNLYVFFYISDYGNRKNLYLLVLGFIQQFTGFEKHVYLC